METKLFEVRDRATFIPVLCVAMTSKQEKEAYLLSRSGYDLDRRPLILMTRCDGGSAHYDPYHWDNRTRMVAHQHITKLWDNLKSGDVIDVEFILGEREAPKVSEREQGI